jgi:uncharacterized phage-associated protein
MLNKCDSCLECNCNTKVCRCECHKKDQTNGYREEGRCRSLVMTYDVIAVADEILRAAKKLGKALTPLQLMKLVYIAHGWSLGLGREDLFKDRIEAWRYGPVIPDLYRMTKRFGRNEIPLNLIGEESKVDPDTAAFLADVVEKYGHLSGYALSQLTHKEGTPWDIAYACGPNTEISDDLIRAHYQGLLNDRSGRTAATEGLDDGPSWATDDRANQCLY